MRTPAFYVRHVTEIEVRINPTESTKYGKKFATIGLFNGWRLNPRQNDCVRMVGYPEVIPVLLGDRDTIKGILNGDY